MLEVFGVGAARPTPSTSSSPHLLMLASNKSWSKMKRNINEWTNQCEKVKYCTGNTDKSFYPTSRHFSKRSRGHKLRLLHTLWASGKQRYFSPWQKSLLLLLIWWQFPEVNIDIKAYLSEDNLKQIQIRLKWRQISKLQRTQRFLNFTFGEKNNTMWTFSNIFLMLLTEIAPQAVLKLKKCETATWSERGIKNIILLNGIYLVLSELFIQLRSS